MGGALFQVDEEGEEIADGDAAPAYAPATSTSALAPWRASAPLAAPVAPTGFMSSLRKTLGVGVGVATLGTVATLAVAYVGWRMFVWARRGYNEWRANVAAASERRRATRAGKGIGVKVVEREPEAVSASQAQPVSFTDPPALEAETVAGTAPTARKARRKMVAT